MWSHADVPLKCSCPALRKIPHHSSCGFESLRTASAVHLRGGDIDSDGAVDRS
uniref:Tetratricopeptide repeat protein n=2 Tax=Tetraselmis sp. GSL018 TaxID=582737 RepID=A0A061RB35_9CHLO